MSFEGADLGFVGPAYEAPMLLQDAQRLINWFVEIDPTTNAKEPVALLGCPGLNPIISTITGAVRGAWVLPGLTSCIFVVGANVYVSTVTAPATQTSIAQFSTVLVGTLLTNSGRVVIRDNGALFGGLGGYAVLVDGTFWTDDEMIGLGLSRKTARDIGHLAQTGPGGMIEWLGKLPAGTRRLLIHINNTNPILDEDSPERATLARAGIEVTHDGMEISL